MEFTRSTPRKRWNRPLLLALSTTISLAMAILLVASWRVTTFQLSKDALRSGRHATGQAQLTSVYAMPEMEGPMCAWEPASAASSFIETLQEQQAAARSLAPTPTAAEKAAVNARPPVRMIKDSYPAFSSVAVDLTHDEVVMTDEATFQILAYNRMENTPPTATMSEPKRMIGGLNTWVEYQCGIYVDQHSGDVYAVNNDTVDRLVVFAHDQKGNVPPERVIMTPHTTYGIAVDEQHQELYLTTQEGAAVVVFRKGAKGDEPPIRLLQGDKTLIADPHGVAVDTTRDLLFVSNFGSVATHSATQKDEGGRFGKYASDRPNWPLLRSAAVPGTGRFLPPSITVYPRDASGDVAPIGVIQGPKTQLNWPTALSLDTKRGEIYVANDTGDSILVFNVDDQGDVAPKRVIKGPKSMVKSPTGVFYDWEHDEVWVSNFGNHTATVYKATASGDVSPLRVIRSAPLDVGTPNIGNAFAPSYDSKRDQLIVPN